MGVLFLLFHVVSEHPVNIVSVAFGDFHPGGAHFVFADGSVHFLQESIDGQTLERLACRNDGLLIGSY